MPSLPSYLPYYLGGDLSGGTAVIQDRAFNPLPTPATASMLGWAEPISSDEALQLRMYLFIIANIRQMDADEGNYLVKRFLDGPQSIWEQVNADIYAIRDLWSVTDCPDQFLPYLKNIVGWTSVYDSITSKLDSDALRRLIANSVAFWKERGSDPAVLSILSQVAGARSKILNWFDFRWVLDETDVSHESDGRDPWIISIGNTNEYNVRIVDDGQLDRELALDLLKLTRPTGERIDVTWLAFLDEFATDDDLSLWDEPIASGTGTLGDSLEAVDGRLRFDSATSHFLILAPRSLEQMLVTARLRGALFDIVFNYQDEDNYLSLIHDEDGFSVQETLAGVDSTLTPVYGQEFTPLAMDLSSAFYHTLRVAVTLDDPIAPTTMYISTYLEGALMARYEYASALISGGQHGLSFHPYSDVLGECDAYEVVALPSETSFIDINSRGL